MEKPSSLKFNDRVTSDSVAKKIINPTRPNTHHFRINLHESYTRNHQPCTRIMPLYTYPYPSISYPFAILSMIACYPQMVLHAIRGWPAHPEVEKRFTTDNSFASIATSHSHSNGMLQYGYIQLCIPKKGSLIAIICYNKLEKEKGEMWAIEPVMYVAQHWAMEESRKVTTTDIDI